jgi:hypothetical protein
MPVYETYASRSAAAAKASAPDVYIYHALPYLLRRQLSLIFEECIGPGGRDWEFIEKIMYREVASYENCGAQPRVSLLTYLQKSTDINGLLTLIEACARIIADEGAMVDPAGGLRELNERFFQQGVGYQFENGKIIRIDSQYVHAEVVKDAIRLLSEPGFEEANEEFMKAHRYLREGSGSLRDCNTAALRAMENVLKVICNARGWAYEKGDTVEPLLAIVQRKGLFPDYLVEDGYFRNLIGAMKAGMPKIRDRQGGHGAAPGDKPVPNHIGAFALHLTAANIVMLVKAFRALPP